MGTGTRSNSFPAGRPARPFSLGGKHPRAFNDARDMFPEAIRAIRQARPKAFLFENVKGLTRTAFRNYFEYVRLQLEHPNVAARSGEDWIDHLARLERHHTSGVRADLHYRVVARVLNAADYGVPQRRERVVFVGFRDDLDIEWTFPEETHSLRRSPCGIGPARECYWEAPWRGRRGRIANPRARDRTLKRVDEPPHGRSAVEDRARCDS